jgi:hypothetical protein
MPYDEEVSGFQLKQFPAALLSFVVLLIMGASVQTNWVLGAQLVVLLAAFLSLTVLFAGGLIAVMRYVEIDYYLNDNGMMLIVYLVAAAVSLYLISLGFL